MTQEEKRKYKLKVNDQEVEKEYTNAEVEKQLQKALAADKGLEEVAMTKKQIQAFVKSMLANPFSVLLDSRSKVDKATLRKSAEEFLAGELEEEQMDPRDRELKKYKAQEEEAAKAKEAETKKAEEEASNKRRDQHASRISQTIAKTLETSGLPKTPYTVKRIASYLHAGLKQGQRPDMNQVVEQVRKDYNEDTSTLFSGMTGEQIWKVLGDELGEKIQAYAVSRLKGGQSPEILKGKEPRIQKGGEPRTFAEWRRNRRK